MISDASLVAPYKRDRCRTGKDSVMPASRHTVQLAISPSRERSLVMSAPAARARARNRVNAAATQKHKAGFVLAGSIRAHSASRQIVLSNLAAD